MAGFYILTSEKLSVVDWHLRLKYTLKARGDEEKCQKCAIADGEPCDYSTISSNEQSSGLSVSSDLAGRWSKLILQ